LSARKTGLGDLGGNWEYEDSHVTMLDRHVTASRGGRERKN
jgi:hypothetical protein